MSHARQQIRDLFVSTLTGGTDAGARVYNSRIYPYSTLPSINVTTPTEVIDDEVFGGKQLRHLTVEVECLVKGNASYASDLDTIAAQVETLIGADVTLGNKLRIPSTSG